MMQRSGNIGAYRRWFIASLYTIIVAGIAFAWAYLSPHPGWLWAGFFAICLLAARFFARSDRQRHLYGALAFLTVVAGQIFHPLDYFSFQHIAFNVPFVSAYLFPRISVGAVLGLTSVTLAILALLNAGLPVSSYWGPLVGLPLLFLICHSLSFVIQRLINEKKELRQANEQLNNEIAERKKIEQQLQALTADLSRKNDELSGALRTLKQTQAQLIRQEKMASVGQLAAGIVHEIYTPVTFITTNIELLENYFTTMSKALARYRHSRPAEEAGHTAEREQALALERILDDFPGLFADTILGLERLNTIVKGMRLFTHPGHGKDTASYDLAEGLESTLLLAHNEIKRYAEVEKHIAPVPAIEAVGGEINQVLLNLLINAAQAIAAKGQGGRGVIKVSAWCDPGYVYCAVEDNGTGIAKQNLGKIFDPFFTTKPPGQGTGLGLSISYNIVVNHHQGDIAVESTEGEGTKFVVKLPIKRE
jgi:signal transduction histidine kinase